MNLVEKHKDDLIYFIRSNIGVNVFLNIEIVLLEHTVTETDIIFKFHCVITSPFELVEKDCMVSYNSFLIYQTLKNGVLWL